MGADASPLAARLRHEAVTRRHGCGGSDTSARELPGETQNFVSKRLGNYQYNPQLGALLSQLWAQ
jgi:hypothetical protein